MFLIFVQLLRPMVTGPDRGARRGRRLAVRCGATGSAAVPEPSMPPLRALPVMVPPFAAPAELGGFVAPPFAVDWLFEDDAAALGVAVSAATSAAATSVTATTSAVASAAAGAVDAAVAEAAFAVRFAAGFFAAGFFAAGFFAAVLFEVALFAAVVCEAADFAVVVFAAADFVAVFAAAVFAAALFAAAAGFAAVFAVAVEGDAEDEAVFGEPDRAAVGFFAFGLAAAVVASAAEVSGVFGVASRAIAFPSIEDGCQHLCTGITLPPKRASIRACPTRLG